MTDSHTPSTADDSPQRTPGPDALVINDRTWLDPGIMQWATSRSSGPGGQSVNKVNTRVQLRVKVSDIHGLSDAAAGRLRKIAGNRLTNEDEVLLDCDVHRSQQSNRVECMERLREMVQQAVTPPKKRKRTRRPKSADRKRLEEKKKTGEKKAARNWKPPRE